MQLLASGCGDLDVGRFRWPWEKSTRVTDPARAADATVQRESAEGTVRAYAYVEGLRKLRIRGFGVVGGLANTGGKDCPTEIRNYLEGEIRRRSSSEDLDLDPKAILDSPRYAAVSVTGEVPAASQKGDRFDLLVRALGNQTTSLEGGRLYYCDLKVFRPTPRGVIEGKAVARAEGAVYVSPFGQKQGAATPSDPRIGRVLGGGVLDDDRRVRLVLNNPSYALVTRIRNRLNSRYGATRPMADAISPTTIQLSVPPEFRQRPRHFIDLVLHTLVDGDPAALERRSGQLAEEIRHPLAAYEDIALTWEAVGRGVVPILRRLYDESLEAAGYFAARTGLRLGDDLALEVVGRHAQDPDSPFRTQAVEELGLAVKSRLAGERLRALLAEADPQIRVAAYQALLARGDPAIESTRVWDDNYVVDMVDCECDPLVYARQSGQPRIAIFGRELALRTPAFYSRPDDLITLSAGEADSQATVVRRNPIHGGVSDPIPVPLELAPLLTFLGTPPRMSAGKADGLGLDYSVALDVLHHLTENRTIPAPFILERPGLDEAIGRTAARERLESEF